MAGAPIGEPSGGGGQGEADDLLTGVPFHAFDEYVFEILANMGNCTISCLQSPAPIAKRNIILMGSSFNGLKTVYMVIKVSFVDTRILTLPQVVPHPFPHPCSDSVTVTLSFITRGHTPGYKNNIIPPQVPRKCFR